MVRLLMGTIKHTVSHHYALPKKGPHANARDIIVVDDFNEWMIILAIFSIIYWGYK